MAERARSGQRVARGLAFHSIMRRLVGRLPFGLGSIIAPEMVGFVVINGFTFSVDIALLTLLRGGAHWPLAVSITLAYVAAFGLSYVLNRVLNFRSHAPVGPQAAVYVAVVVLNYLAWILGFADGLAAAGVDYRLARIVAGAGEAVCLYVALRWWVFRVRVIRSDPIAGADMSSSSS